MVDVGAYTERGEWVDAFLHLGQIKDDGGYVAHVDHSALTPGKDLPELFMGKPRPYSVHDIEKGMKAINTGYGFYNWERIHKYAWTAYPRGQKDNSLKSSKLKILRRTETADWQKRAVESFGETLEAWQERSKRSVRAFLKGGGLLHDFEDTDDFAEDEFADDDFADESEYIADDVPFSLSTEEEEHGFSGFCSAVGDVQQLHVLRGPSVAAVL
eukprot:Skav231426  [mRNA]  locus=scaffold330:136937:141556:+ [translate_table: standard]